MSRSALHLPLSSLSSSSSASSLLSPSSTKMIQKQPFNEDVGNASSSIICNYLDDSISSIVIWNDDSKTSLGCGGSMSVGSDEDGNTTNHHTNNNNNNNDSTPSLLSLHEQFGASCASGWTYSPTSTIVDGGHLNSVLSSPRQIKTKKALHTSLSTSLSDFDPNFHLVFEEEDGEEEEEEEEKETETEFDMTESETTTNHDELFLKDDENMIVRCSTISKTSKQQRGFQNPFSVMDQFLRRPSRMSIQQRRRSSTASSSSAASSSSSCCKLETPSSAVVVVPSKSVRFQYAFIREYEAEDEEEDYDHENDDSHNNDDCTDNDDDEQNDSSHPNELDQHKKDHVDQQQEEEEEEEDDELVATSSCNQNLLLSSLSSIHTYRNKKMMMKKKKKNNTTPTTILKSATQYLRTKFRDSVVNIGNRSIHGYDDTIRASIERKKHQQQTTGSTLKQQQHQQQQQQQHAPHNSSFRRRM